MTDRPILFSAPMVRAILAGRKTQTRRLTKDQSSEMPIGGAAYDRDFAPQHPYFWRSGFDGSPIKPLDPQPKIQIGDRLWVRESWQLHSRATDFCTVAYMASVNHSGWSDAHELFPDKFAAGMRPIPFQQGWRPSIHMPRWASRLTLTVTEIRVDRLQNINERDAYREGAPLAGENTEYGDERNYYEGFMDVWDSINGKTKGATWADNPWVAAYTFTVEKRNIDA